jgi:hypothetical protein
MTEEKFFHNIIDCTTGETTTREFTEEEYAQAAIDKVARENEIADQLAAEQAQAEAKASGIAKLLALGLTEAEANALVK